MQNKKYKCNPWHAPVFAFLVGALSVALDAGTRVRASDLTNVDVDSSSSNVQYYYYNPILKTGQLDKPAELEKYEHLGR